ncbi:MAG: FHA domain-containing protein [Planctomycetota bacterium]|jgi:hypothetical protein
MESLKGFVRRHGKMSRKAFLRTFTRPFLASPPSKSPHAPDPENLFPGAWVILLKASLDTRITVGRESANDIWIDDVSISKQHCYFIQEGKDFQIADNNSTNGTFINGHPITPHMNRTLRSGDKIGLGEQISFHFFLPGDLYKMLFEPQTKGRKD